MSDEQHNGIESAPPQDGVRIETINGRQELVVPGRFELGWAPEAVDALDEEQIGDFQTAISTLSSHMRDEISADEGRQAEARADRSDALMALSTVLRVPGASLAFPDRNTRYTSMDGMKTMPEEIVPGRGMDEQGPHGGIPNPFNSPEFK